MLEPVGWCCGQQGAEREQTINMQRPDCSGATANTINKPPPQKKKVYHYVIELHRSLSISYRYPPCMYI